MPALACEVIEVGLEELLLKSTRLPACHIGVELLDAAGTACTRNEVVPSVIIEEDGSVVVHTVELNA